MGGERMSLQDFDAFAAKMKADDKFRDKVLAVADVEDRLAMIKSEGFDCSAEEFEQVQAELKEIEVDSDCCAIFCAPAHL